MGLDGLYFCGGEDGDLGVKGRVLERVEENWYLVQFFEARDPRLSGPKRLVTTAQMAGWAFYSDEVALNSAVSSAGSGE